MVLINLKDSLMQKILYFLKVIGETYNLMQLDRENEISRMFLRNIFQYTKQKVLSHNIIRLQ